MSSKYCFQNVHSDTTVLMIHGMASDSTSWDATEKHLNFRGYNTVTVDLTGHGDSPHKDSYSFYRWVAEICETLEKAKIQPSIIIGHSLGGLLAAGVAHQLQVAKVVFIDPLLHVPSDVMQYVIKTVMARYDKVSLNALRKQHPSWSEPMLMQELNTLEKWDKKTLSALNSEDGWDIASRFIFNQNHPECLLIKPVKSFLIPESYVKVLTDNKVPVTVVHNAGHSVHRDNLKSYMQIIDNFVSAEKHSFCD